MMLCYLGGEDVNLFEDIYSTILNKLNNNFGGTNDASNDISTAYSNSDKHKRNYNNICQISNNEIDAKLRK